MTHIVYSGLGGTADYALNLINGDANQQVDHQLIFYGVEKTAESLLDEAKKLTPDVVFIPKNPGIDKEALSSLATVIKAFQPDLISLHVNSLIYHLPKLVSGETKIVFVEHQANHLKTKKEWIWSALAQLKSDYVVALTPEYQATLKKGLRFLYRPKKNKLIRTGIQLNNYRTDRNTDLHEQIKIGMVSRVNALKDHSTLLTAFSEIESDTVEMHIAGDGDMLENLKRQFQHPKIHFHGMVPRKEVPHFLSKLSIYVQASFGETSSISLMQAQASGLPIVASDVKGLNSVINSGNGLLVPVKNVPAMKQALISLVNDTEKRTKLAKASLNYAQENLDNKRMFHHFFSIL